MVWTKWQFQTTITTWKPPKTSWKLFFFQQVFLNYTDTAKMTGRNDTFETESSCSDPAVHTQLSALDVHCCCCFPIPHYLRTIVKTPWVLNPKTLLLDHLKSTLTCYCVHEQPKHDVISVASASCQITADPRSVEASVNYSEATGETVTPQTQASWLLAPKNKYSGVSTLFFATKSGTRLTFGPITLS